MAKELMRQLKMGKLHTTFVKVWLTSSTSAVVIFYQKCGDFSQQPILSKAARTASDDLDRVWSDAN